MLTGGGKMEQEWMQLLPEIIISNIISLTTPLEACRLATVSPLWRSAADSDTVWERFLPSDYKKILSRAVNPVNYSSLKELFFRLCDSILIDGGRKMYSLKRSKGRVCVVLSPMDLYIFEDEEIDNPWYWFYTSDPSLEWWSNLWMGGDPPLTVPFAKLALLQCSYWIKISGMIPSKMLSPKTYYSIRLIFRLSSESIGLRLPFKAEIIQGNMACTQRVFLHRDMLERWISIQERSSILLRSLSRCRGPGLDEKMGDLRNDGWDEVEIGRFYCDVGVDGEDGEVLFSLSDESLRTKCGLLLQGIGLFPLN